MSDAASLSASVRTALSSGAFHQLDTCAHVQLRRHAGLMLLAEFTAEVAPRVMPGLDRVAMQANGHWQHCCLPAVVAEQTHRHTLPGALAHAPQQLRGEHLVPIHEDVSLDGDRLADDDLHRKTAAVNARRQPLDDDARCSERLAQFGGVRWSAHRLDRRAGGLSGRAICSVPARD